MRRIFAIAAAITVVLALVLVATGAARPFNLGNYFFGPKLVRAEVILFDGTLHDYRVDRGKIRANTGSSLTLLERDGSLVTVPVSPTADVSLGSLSVPLTRLRRGFTATTVRDGASAPASIVVATR